MSASNSIVVTGAGKFGTGNGPVKFVLSNDSVSLEKSKGAKFEFFGDVDAVTGSGNSATLTGTGSYKGVPGHTFTISVVDNGTPGQYKDTIDVVIRNAAGAVVFTSGGPDTLKAGEITVD